MAAITITDLDNGKLDVELIQKLATSAELEATDRFGTTKKTWAGIEQDLGAAYAIETTGANRLAAEDAAALAVTASDVAIARGRTYATPADGVNPSGTPPGVGANEYFSVPSASSRDSLDLYRNVAGAAVLQVGKSIPAADAVLKPVQTGLLNGWLDSFFQRTQIGVDFLGRQRWRSNINNGFGVLTLVQSSLFGNGKALRRTGTGTPGNCGPVVWLDDMEAAPGDTVTIYALVTGPAGRDAYLFGRFYTAANVPASGGIAGGDFQGVRASGDVGVIHNGSSQYLRITAVIPADAAAIALFPYSSTQGAAESFDVHAVWAFRGGAAAGPAWPVFGDGAWDRKATELLSTQVEDVDTRIAATEDALAELAGSPTQLRDFKVALTDPLHQFIGTVLIGDSKTWGWGASGGLPVDPRTGQLTDRRNSAAARSWANLLHEYLGLQYFEDVEVTAEAWPGSDGGVAIFNYEKTYDLNPSYTPFTSVNHSSAGGAGSWVSVINAESKLGYYRQATVNLSNDDLRFAFKMTGYEFAITYATLSNGAAYELLVDGVAQGTFSTQTGDTGLPAAFGNVRVHSLGGFKQNALVELRVIPGDIARFLLRLEAVTITKKLRFTNNGINGSSTRSYATYGTTMLQEGDQFAFVQLGTNDRGDISTNNRLGMNSLAYGLNTILNTLTGEAVKPILVCGTAVTNNALPTYKYTMSDVRSVIRTVARDRAVDFIDHFAETRMRLAAGDSSFLSDGLHCNDEGQMLEFTNIRTRIDAA